MVNAAESSSSNQLLGKSFAGIIGYKESKFINSSQSIMEARNGK